MSKKASKTKVGAFVLGAIVLAVTGVVVFGGGRFFQDSTKVIMYFEGSAGGLNVGAPIVLKGVEIGSVADIDLQFDVESMEYRTAVAGEVFPSITYVGDPDMIQTLEEGAEEKGVKWVIGLLIDRGLRAQLGLQSFVTGMLHVELDLHDDVGEAQLGPNIRGVVEIPTLSSDMDRLERTLEEIDFEAISKDLRQTIEGVNALVNSDEIKRTVENVEKASADLQDLIAKVNERADEVEADVIGLLEAGKKFVEDLDREVSPLAASLDQTLSELRELMAKIDGQVEPLSSSLNETLADTRTLIKNADAQIDPLSTSFQESARAATATLDEARDTLALLRGRVPSDATLLYQVSTTLDSISQASDSMKALMSYLQRHPEALIKGKGN